MRTSMHIALALTACLTGCVVGSEPDDAPDIALSQSALTSNRHAAFDFFVEKGLTQRQSAGIVGNLIQESGVDPTAKQFGGGPGRGIAQWSVGGRWDTSSHDNVTSFASFRSESRWALHTQLAFVWYELNTVGGYGLPALRSSTTIREATLVFARDFEICGTCDNDKRIRFAQDVFDAFAHHAASAVVMDAEDDAVYSPADAVPSDGG